MNNTKMLREVAECWLRMKREQVKESSFAAYTFQVKRHLLPRFGDMTHIDEECVQEYVGCCLRRGTGVATVRERIGILRMMVRYAARKEWMRYDDWKIRYVCHRLPSSVPILAPTHQSMLLRHVQQHLSARNLGVYICLTTGLRIGEICGLQWGDIDDSRCVMTIRRTVERIYDTEDGRGSTRVVCSTPKTLHSYRMIPVGAALLAMAATVRGTAQADCYVLTGTLRPTEPRTYRTYFKRLLQTVGVPAIRFHALRHSFATRCIESNCDSKTVSEILGHANVGITLNLYTHPGMTQKRRCIESLIQQLEGKECP